MKSGIYRIINTVNGKVYIGSTIDFVKRWKEHRRLLNKGSHTGTYLQRAWNKYGELAFDFEIVEEVDPANLLEREQFYLDQLFEAGSHYNVLPTAGSSLGAKRSPESCARLSAAAKIKTTSLEALKIHRGNNNGRKASDETRAKMSASRKGMIYSTEARTNSSSNKGYKHTEESKARMSATRKGVKKEPRSEETKAKIAEKLKGKPFSDERKANVKEGIRRRNEERKKLNG